MDDRNNSLWGGRFQKAPDEAMKSFHSSISIDGRMAREDILGSIAHARMLKKQDIIGAADADAIIAGLTELLSDVEEGKVEFTAEAEDVHMNIETLLTKRIGEAGKRLHTGRSRNDQVALDTRMYMKRGALTVTDKLTELEEALLDTAEAHVDTIMPGLTHLQKAQPITLAHHLMAYFEMFRRDISRVCDCYTRMDEMPLGSGALATSTYPVDRQAVGDELGFSCITRNSLDSVSDRDFLIEFVACSSIIMMHLSRFCEELILWCSGEFGFVDMDDAFSTGSSIMPQKKNPDAAELIRGKTGRVYGDLMTILTIMKGLPLAYNKDMQEDKEAVFDALDTVTACLDIFTRMFKTLRINKDNMRKAAEMGFTNATDAADYLVKKNVPFRVAHEIVGKLVFYCIERDKSLTELTLEEFCEASTTFDEDVYEAISLETCVNNRNVPGGPAKEAVIKHIYEGRAWINGNSVD